jgi:hypothetical protein
VDAEVLRSAHFYPVDPAGQRAGFFCFYENIWRQISYRTTNPTGSAVLALEIQNCIPRGGLRTQKKVDIIFSVQIFAVQASFIVVVIEN